MKKLLSALAICLFCTVGAQAQDYKTAIGLRLGYPASVSLKHFLNEKGAVELFAGYRGSTYWNWVLVGGAYQHHSPIESVEGLKWFVGGGASAFFWTYDDVYFANDNYGSVSFGILANAGLDYKFADYPINLSVDWMPIFFVNGYGSGFGGGYGAVSARYTLK